MSTPILLFNSHQYHHQPNPRDRYLTALAEVKAAEEQYVAYAHAHEKALQRQREEEIHRHIVLALQQQHKEAVRGQRLFDVLEQETSLTGGYPERYYFGTPEADIYEELAARKALSRMNYPHQGALLNRRRLALLQEHREQAKARALALARHRGEEQTRLSRLSEEGDLKSILNLLFESGATTRGAPSRADLVSNSVPATLSQFLICLFSNIVLSQPPRLIKGAVHTVHRTKNRLVLTSKREATGMKLNTS